MASCCRGCEGVPRGATFNTGTVAEAARKLMEVHNKQNLHDTIFYYITFDAVQYTVR